MKQDSGRLIPALRGAGKESSRRFCEMKADRAAWMWIALTMALHAGIWWRDGWRTSPLAAPAFALPGPMQRTADVAPIWWEEFIDPHPAPPLPESGNYWDCLVDPIYFLVSLSVLGVSLWRRARIALAPPSAREG